ncbi:hypothetical protein FO440_24145 [Mucilaginibacter corticis]|uniref:DUF5655 domain-containing protein n=1 Tax=Mucilaginibacter corticis TaxID=2597670 RepID=A0A556M4S2_9SPHI|nr:DUF5655 domain-containing protein [Mucilaginibacter corticis]TSJ34902.1 hypothetical protein FO440_24145 [Mucilaginibacter corticis]
MSWTCPKCERELPWKDYRHYCARVSVDSLFEGRSSELVLAFDKLLAEVADWQKVLVSTTPNCIVFYRRWAFLIIRPMKKWLELKYYAKDTDGKKQERKVKVFSVDEFPPNLFNDIRQSYLL